MQETVSPQYRRTFLDPTKTMDEWYARIYKIREATQPALKQEARQQYKALIKPFPKAPKDLGAWVTNWEAVVSKGLDKGLDELKVADNLSSNLEITLGEALPEWITSYRMIDNTAI